MRICNNGQIARLANHYGKYYNKKGTSTENPSIIEKSQEREPRDRITKPRLGGQSSSTDRIRIHNTYLKFGSDSYKEIRSWNVCDTSQKLSRKGFKKLNFPSTDFISGPKNVQYHTTTMKRWCHQTDSYRLTDVSQLESTSKRSLLNHE